MNQDDLKLFMEHMPLANGIAWDYAKKLPSNYDIDDLKSAAYEGLLKAIDKHDEKRGPFVGYAKLRIVGSIRDFLRAWDPLSRRSREKINELRRGQAELHATGREWSSVDVAVLVGWTQERVDEALELNRRSQPAWPLARGGHADSALGPEDVVVARVFVEQVLEVMRRHLTDQQFDVMLESFVNEEPSVDIARRMGLSESRISQIRKKAIETIRYRIGLLDA